MELTILETSDLHGYLFSTNYQKRNMDEPLGTVSGNMEIKDAHMVRLKEHPYIELIHKVQMEATGAAISGTSLLTDTGKGFQQTITMRDIVTNYIYPNTLAVLDLTGAELKAAIEKAAGYFALESDGSIGLNWAYVHPKPQYYNYDMYEGIDYTIDVSKPIGDRLVRFEKDGRPIQDEERLEVVTNQYRAIGGGDYTMFDASKIIREVTKDMSELIADYIKKHSIIDATVNDNFLIVNGEEIQ